MANKAKKRQKTIILYGSFAAVLIALVLVIVFRRSDRMQYGLPDTPVISAGEIDEISIDFSNGNEVTLRRGDPGWTITPEGYPVDAGAVEDMLESLSEFTLTDLVSTSGHYVQYELDEENKLAVTASGDGDELITFDLGKRSSSYNHTYVTVGDGQVYLAATDLRRVFDKEIDALRDRKVLTFAKDEIVEISASLPGLEINLAKSSPTITTSSGTVAGDAMWTDQAGEEWPAESIDEFLGRLNNLSCSEFADEPSEEGLEPLLKLDLKGIQTYKFTLLAEDETGFRATTSQSPYEFYISSWLGNSILDTFKPGDAE